MWPSGLTEARGTIAYLSRYIFPNECRHLSLKGPSCDLQEAFLSLQSPISPHKTHSNEF